MAVEAWDAEINRISALRMLRRLTTPRVERFDHIARLAREVLSAPVAILSLHDTDHRWLASGAGLAQKDTRHVVSLCSNAIGPEQLTVIPDLADDCRFADHPVVTGPQKARFLAGRPIVAPSGGAVGMLCVLDVRPRERLSDAERAGLADLAAWAELECVTVQASLGLREASRTERDFVAVVSHELRTPLTSVHGSLELLASGLAGQIPPSARELVDVAVKNTDRLVRLVNDVLDLSRVQRGELCLRLQDVALDEVVDQAVHAVAGTAKRDGVAVTANHADVSVRGDADRLIQVVTNLLANAVSLSPPGESVDVRCENGGSHARIHVIDRGPGLAKEQLVRIFEPFVQVNPAGLRQGAGLGLAITRAIVEAHDGTVSARSAPGAGATFTVSLPVGGPPDNRPWW